MYKIIYKIWKEVFLEFICPIFVISLVILGLFCCVCSPRHNVNYNQEYQIYDNVLPSTSKIEKSLGNGWFIVEIEDNRYLMQIKGSIVLKVVRE